MEDEIDTKMRSDHVSAKFFASLGGYDTRRSGQLVCELKP